MSLADYQPAREIVEFKGGSVSVRGLSLDDVSVLMSHHLSDLDNLLDIYRRGVDESLAVAATAQYAIRLVKEAPGLVAHLIALAVDEPSHVDKARGLPMPTQIRILEVAGRLTFEEAGGAKKFVESLGSLINNMKTPASRT